MQIHNSQSRKSNIPADWQICKLGKIVDMNKVSVDPRKELFYRKFLYIDIDSIENETGHVGSYREVMGIDAPSRARRVVHYNDVIMSTVRPYLKAFALIPEEYDNSICSTGFAVLTCRNMLLPSYLLYSLFSKDVIAQCNRMMVGGQYPALNANQVVNISIPLPPLPEQRRIAEILSTVDEAIEKVDEAIEKTERLKNGLMQELLTKGIGHKEFKDTEIGIIPKEWKVVTAEEFCTRVTDGTHDTPKPTKEGQFLITSKHIKNGHIDFSDAYLISEENFDDINKRSQVNSFDVLFSMIGTIGETAVVDKYYPGFAIKNVGLFKVDGNKALAYWLNYYFKSKYARGYIRNNQKGTTQKYMPLFALRHFPILNPSIEEKERIINIINATVQQLEFLQKKKIGLRRIKKGMMNDLLTGNKRVNIFYHSNSSPLTGEDKGGGD